MAGYVGSRGKNLIRLGDANLAPETIVNGVKTYQPQLGRRNPELRGLWQRVTDAESFYNSLQVSADEALLRRLAGAGLVHASESVDDASGINSQDFSNVVQYGLGLVRPRLRPRPVGVPRRAQPDLQLDLGPARSLATSTGLAGALLGDGSSTTSRPIRSGHPFTVELGFNRSGNLNTTSFSRHERPDLERGCSNNPILGGPDRYWDINCFQLPAANTRGNLGRNTLIGPGLVSIDVSLVKSFDLGGERTLQVRVEVFNVPNHPNFAVPSGRTASPA